MEIWTESVDWDRYLKEWQAQGEGLVLSDGEEQGWSQVTTQTLECDSLILNELTGTAFDKLRSLLPEGLEQTTHQFLSAFCFVDGGDGFDPPKDGGFTKHDVIVGVFSPESIRHYLALFNCIEFEAIRRAFDQVVMPDGGENSITADEFCNYLQMWGSIFRDAVENERGLLLCIA